MARGRDVTARRGALPRPEAAFTRRIARDEARHDACSCAGMAPFRTLNDPRSSLLVCDGCDAFMMRDGKPATKPHHQADPDDLAPHYQPRADVEAAATSSGWVLEGDRWSCPPCSSKRSPAP